MKRKIISIAIFSILAIAGTSVLAQQPDKKASSIRKDISEDQKALAKAKKDSASEYQKFKKETELKIQKNERDIAELKAKKADENKETQAKYNEKVAKLEQKNNDLKKSLYGYKGNDASSWATFKRNLNKNMDELAKNIQSLGNNNNTNKK